MANQAKRPSGPDFTEGVPAADLHDGCLISGRMGEEAVLLARVDDAIFAVSAKCTHYGGPLGKGVLSGETVHCPWHHACFSLRTGEAVRAPAIDPIARWRTETSGERIFVREKLAKAAPAAGAKRGSSEGTGRFVIVGGGAAGFAAAERLRRDGFCGDLVVLSADEDPPVDRPNLSKDFLAGKAPADWVFVKPPAFYTEHAIDLQLGARVTFIDVHKREVRLADERKYAFDKLLLATGAEPVRLPIAGADKSHVHTLRSFADSRAIAGKAGTSNVAVVIGASFIGLEVAASLVARGLEVHVVAPGTRPLEHVLGPELGDLIRAEHEAHGVVFHLGRRPAAIGDADVTLDDGMKLNTDLVVMGVGVRPRTGLAHEAGLRTDHGVLVDAFMETDVAGIFAAGDIARFPYALAGGGAVRVEHWVVAEQQGQAVATNMLGARKRYDQAPFFWSQHYDLPINYVGHAGKWDAVEVSGDLKAHDALIKYRRDGQVVAVASIHRDRDSLRAELDLENSASTPAY